MSKVSQLLKEKKDVVLGEYFTGENKNGFTLLAQ